ncbi:MmcQ/YjbR family DNA-binding protein [Agromyces seonyuensis]|uniref:MmcQ/YjbR family DNA-binding protein n=1 Tax=Agromyces seonyuensis TaxID=2662446 RepID=A0A6I4NSL9_9MICO|nr:hypothetical protein [Agromyces seonyuensis]MWB97253.1 hypothetical protein [Agromyces seonyuensis]
MPTFDDVRDIALSLPGVTEGVEGHRGGAAWRTARGMVVWERGPGRTDLEQLAELGRSWPDGHVAGARTDGVESAAALVETFPEAFFTIPHFTGYPAVLVILDTVDPAQLREVIVEAWLTRVPARVGAAWLAGQGNAEDREP